MKITKLKAISHKVLPLFLSLAMLADCCQSVPWEPG